MIIPLQKKRSQKIEHLFYMQVVLQVCVTDTHLPYSIYCTTLLTYCSMSSKLNYTVFINKLYKTIKINVYFNYSSTKKINSGLMK